MYTGVSGNYLGLKFGFLIFRNGDGNSNKNPVRYRILSQKEGYTNFNPAFAVKVTHHAVN